MALDNALNAIHSNLNNLQKINDGISKNLLNVLTEHGNEQMLQSSLTTNEADVQVSNATNLPTEATTKSTLDLADKMVSLILIQRDIAANATAIKITNSIETTLFRVR